MTQIKRSVGQSAVAAAAYRAGEKLHSAYYGEDSDYTRKGGVICSEILLPSHAPPEYADRETLWNAVEKVERGKKAQLAYSFDIALQNEFSMQENIDLARQFLLDNFVNRGMVADFAVHQPDKEDGGISNAFDEPKQWEIRKINEIMNQCVTGWTYFSNPRNFAGYGRQKGWERERAATGSGNHAAEIPDGFVEITEQIEMPF